MTEPALPAAPSLGVLLVASLLSVFLVGLILYGDTATAAEDPGMGDPTVQKVPGPVHAGAAGLDAAPPAPSSAPSHMGHSH